MMKKLSVQIHQQRFELESRSGDEDALIQATARALTARIEKLRREHGFPDSARATALAALLIALEAKNSDNALVPVIEEGRIKALGEQIDKTLARTDGSPAKAFTQ